MKRIFKLLTFFVVTSGPVLPYLAEGSQSQEIRITHRKTGYVTDLSYLEGDWVQIGYQAINRFEDIDLKVISPPYNGIMKGLNTMHFDLVSVVSYHAYRNDEFSCSIEGKLRLDSYDLTSASANFLIDSTDRCRTPRGYVETFMIKEVVLERGDSMEVFLLRPVDSVDFLLWIAPSEYLYPGSKKFSLTLFQRFQGS